MVRVSGRNLPEPLRLQLWELSRHLLEPFLFAH